MKEKGTAIGQSRTGFVVSGHVRPIKDEKNMTRTKVRPRSRNNFDGKRSANVGQGRESGHVRDRNTRYRQSNQASSAAGAVV